MFSLNVK